VNGAQTPAFCCWCHPRATGAAGRCIGRTHLRVDPRRAMRLAHRLRATARREQLPRAAVAVDAAQWPTAPRHGALVRWPAPDATHPG